MRQCPERGTAAALLPFVNAWPPQQDVHDAPARICVRWLSTALREMSAELAARRARRELMKLDDRLLEDIGVSRCELLGGRVSLRVIQR